MYKLFIFITALLLSISVRAQTTSIQGAVVDYTNNSSLPFATIQILNNDQVFSADENGHFNITLPPGLYNIQANYTGYTSLVLHEIKAISDQPTYINFALQPTTLHLDEVQIVAKAYSNTPASPLALHQINLYELENLPGATLDVSKFIKSLPGVAPKVSFGYNLIVRGGAANENRYFLDDIEIPSLTHFSVQGAGGGPNGILNVDLLKDAKFHASAFPANTGNALSSQSQFHTRNGRKDKFGGSFSLGATDFTFLFEGPAGKKASWIFSARESFSQHMLKALGIPVIPFYADAQFKYNLKLNPKNEISIIGLAAHDRYTLNLEAEKTPSRVYNIGYIPEGKQQQYTFGGTYTHYLDNSFYKIILSRTAFKNVAEKYIDNTNLAEDLKLNYQAEEIANRIRIEHHLFTDELQWSYGINYENTKLITHNYELDITQHGQPDTTDYFSFLGFSQYGAFADYSRPLFNNQLQLYIGLRIDGNNYNKQMSNPFKQLSPRLSLSHPLSPQWTINAHTGWYHQIPPAVLLAYKNNGILLNKNNLDYMSNIHTGLGIEHITDNGYRFRLEGFMKKYNNYPFLLKDSISLANANANYVVVGDQLATSNSTGIAYGIEFQAKQKMKKNFFWNLTYSYVVSQFENKQGKLSSSAWDNRHAASITLGKLLPKQWQIGCRWTIAGGSPYTPYNQALSAQKQVWDILQRGLADYNQLNEATLPTYHQLDIRIDKHFNFKKWRFSFWLDLQNVYRSSIATIPYLTPIRNGEFQPITHPDNPQLYQMELLDSDTGRLLPSLGLKFAF